MEVSGRSVERSRCAGSRTACRPSRLPHADWMPAATVVAMRASLEKSALFAGQRLAGAIIGAAVALFLLRILFTFPAWR